MNDLKVELEQRKAKVEVRKYPLFSVHNFFAFLFFVVLFGLLIYLVFSSYTAFAFAYGDTASNIAITLLFLLFFYAMYRIHRRRRTVYSDIPSRNAVISTVGQVLDPVNMVLILGNVFVFVLVQTLFFWYVASQNTVDSAKDLADLGIAVTRETGKLNGCQLLPYDQNLYYQAYEENWEVKETKIGRSESFEKVVAEAAEARREREKSNVIPTVKYIGTFLAVVALLILLNLYRAKQQGRRFTKIEGVLFLATVLAFATEISFYLLVVRSVQYIGEFEAIAELRFPYDTREISGFVNPYIGSNEVCPS